MRGFCGIGVWHSKSPVNLGTLWRTAQVLGNVDHLFTVGRRYERQSSDTMKAIRHIPLFHFADFPDLKAHLPFGCQLIGVEMDTRALDLAAFTHPEAGCYLLGAEDHGLSPEVVAACHRMVRLRGERSMNVAVAGSIVLYDRLTKADVREGTSVDAERFRVGARTGLMIGDGR